MDHAERQPLIHIIVIQVCGLHQRMICTDHRINAPKIFLYNCVPQGNRMIDTHCSTLLFSNLNFVKMLSCFSFSINSVHVRQLV